VATSDAYEDEDHPRKERRKIEERCLGEVASILSIPSLSTALYGTFGTPVLSTMERWLE